MKQQDCINNSTINDILNEIEREQIGKIKTVTDIGNLSSKPETKMLCNVMVNFVPAIDVFDKEDIEKLRKEIAETNAARIKNGLGELVGSEVTRCLTLFEDKYNTAWGYHSGYVLFANKEEAMNFEPKEGNKYKIKLRNIVYYIRLNRAGEESSRIKIYDYVGQN